MEYRYANEIPPGYQDSAKPDNGIGDLLIWFQIIEVGKSLNKNVIFVTGETKSDWCVRANKQGIFTRYELVRGRYDQKLWMMTAGQLKRLF
jgi:hypothetical protein